MKKTIELDTKIQSDKNPMPVEDKLVLYSIESTVTPDITTSQQCHVESKSNPADVVSKAVEAVDTKPPNTWLLEPESLRKDQSHSPETVPKVKLKSDDIVVDKNVPVNAVTSRNCINDLIAYCSDSITNLVSCDMEIRTSIKSCYQSQIERHMTQSETKWILKPPGGLGRVIKVDVFRDGRVRSCVVRSCASKSVKPITKLCH